MRDLPVDGQGCVPDQRDGHHQGDRGEGCRGEEQELAQHEDLLHEIRECDVLARQRDPPVDRADPERPSRDGDRARDDALHHEP